MKKQTFTAALLSTLLIIAIAGTLLIKSGRADPMFDFVITQKIVVVSPEASKNYYSSRVNLTFSISNAESEWWDISYGVRCLLDGGLIFATYGASSKPFSVSMWNLSIGRHVIRITADVRIQPLSQWVALHFNGEPWEGVHRLDTGDIEFFANAPLNVSILESPNKVYDVTEFPLRFTVNRLVSWMGYSLDGQDNISISGNTTLTGLSNGEHNVQVYARDYEGNFTISETITFNIDVPELTEPFPTTLVIASIESVAVVSIGLLVYFKKRRRNMNAPQLSCKL